MEAAKAHQLVAVESIRRRLLAFENTCGSAKHEKVPHLRVLSKALRRQHYFVGGTAIADAMLTQYAEDCLQQQEEGRHKKAGSHCLWPLAGVLCGKGCQWQGQTCGRPLPAEELELQIRFVTGRLC